jgi:NADH-quinone oxidoreductase subunit H
MGWNLLFFFPGFIGLILAGLLLEFADRKLYARFQNRVGPPWYQPFADLIKLFGKETIIPAEADRRMFSWIPVFALASISTAVLYIPTWSTGSAFSFQGDIVVILYLLTIPTLAFFLGGWYSASLYSEIGSVRTLTQLFAIEAPLFMAFLGPAMLANTWDLSGVARFYAAHPLYALANLPGFAVSVIVTQGKLERAPFDTPEAETEIVAGSFTEYSGRYLAMFKLTIDIGTLIIASLIAAVFIPVFSDNFWLGALLYLAKLGVIIFLFAAIRSVMARFRIEQMVRFCWMVLTPLTLAQTVIDIFLKG